MAILLLKIIPEKPSFLFSEDYLRLSPFLQQGATVFITGYFKPRYNKDEFEFKVQPVSLAETMKNK